MTITEKALELLKKSAKQFRYYQRQHEAKGTPESLAKAQVNADLAEEIEGFTFFAESDAA